MTLQRFVFEVPEADVQDLRARLGRTRWPIPWPATGWEAGTDAAELDRLMTDPMTPTEAGWHGRGGVGIGTASFLATPATRCFPTGAQRRVS